MGARDIEPDGVPTGRSTAGAIEGRMLVTGGTGYLGRVVASVAAVSRWEVVAVGSADADIRDRSAVLGLARSTAPDVIVHTAYVKDTPAAQAVIEDGTANVAHAAVAVGARLLHISSDVVFDGHAGRPYTELDRPAPVNDYGRAKLAAERLVGEIAPDSLIVRTSLIYGGPQRPASPHERAAGDPSAVFYDDEVRCPIQVDDLAGALVELAGTDLSGILHVAGPEALSRRRFAELIVGHPVRGAPAPPGRPLDCRLDIGVALAVLSTPPRAVSDVYPGG